MDCSKPEGKMDDAFKSACGRAWREGRSSERLGPLGSVWFFAEGHSMRVGAVARYMELMIGQCHQIFSLKNTKVKS